MHYGAHWIWYKDSYKDSVGEIFLVQDWFHMIFSLVDSWTMLILNEHIKTIFFIKSVFENHS